MPEWPAPCTGLEEHNRVPRLRPAHCPRSGPRWRCSRLGCYVQTRCAAQMIVDREQRWRDWPELRLRGWNGRALGRPKRTLPFRETATRLLRAEAGLNARDHDAIR